MIGEEIQWNQNTETLYYLRNMVTYHSPTVKQYLSALYFEKAEGMNRNSSLTPI